MRWKSTLAFLLFASSSLSFPALATVDDDAEIILVRKDCGTLDNCFETIADALSWTWGTREPSASSPLLWDVGPGTWNEQWSCENNGYVTVRGAGREQTIIEANTIGAVSVDDCEQLEFIDIGIHGNTVTVFWEDDGSSTWTNVDIVGTDGGSESLVWADDFCDGSFQAQHYFFGSRIILRDVDGTGYSPAAWYGNCSDTWFYGGEILAEWNENKTGGVVYLLNLSTNTRFQAFGTALRGVVTDTPTSTSGILTAVSISGTSGVPTSMFHMHGGIISLLTNPSHSVSVAGLSVGSYAVAHTPGTAFNLRPGSSSLAYRTSTSGSGAVDSPFLWQSGSTPPVAGGETNVLASTNGEDMFVETDCDGDGDCDGAGNQAHLMVYNPDECGSSEPWFDTVTGRCRNDTGS